MIIKNKERIIVEKRKVIHHSEVANETKRSSITTYEDGEIVISFQQLQLDRVENKMDRILELLEGKELSISSLIKASDQLIKLKVGNTEAIITPNGIVSKI